MRYLLLLFVLPLLFIGCSKENKEEKVIIKTPSGKQVETVCPGEDAVSQTLCQEARVLIEEPLPPLTRMGCMDNNFYSVRVFLYDKNDQKKEVGFLWDCNGSIRLGDLRDAVEARAEQELGTKTGKASW